ncbi:TM2 domain-containing protein [Brochothrix thermosphacta]|uniref:TM2 domain-containing protein n=1 Tax=Brochothrix thermosphacta TaxID=2756 RepID=UPI000D792402|nr:TM2 domain-containing protein [Brochothrix thermosphacta]SPN75482.1 conserved hypothetical protein [Brochothrix thermosphacta]
MKNVNKVLYIVFALFLGHFGVHKFYAGKTGVGVLFLIFCWTGIPGVIGIIQGILAIFKSADSEGDISV